MSKAVEITAGLIAIVAGVYMLITQAAASNSIFNPLLHGVGLYILARGLWMLRTAGQGQDVLDRLDKIIELETRAVKRDRTT